MYLIPVRFHKVPPSALALCPLYPISQRQVERAVCVQRPKLNLLPWGQGLGGGGRALTEEVLCFSGSAHQPSSSRESAAIAG